VEGTNPIKKEGLSEKGIENFLIRKRVSRSILILAITAITLFMGCDATRVFETNIELEDQLWLRDSLLHFDFEITQSKEQYNLLANIQYASDFEFRNLYLTYTLYDSVGQQVDKSLINTVLFSDKVGKPLGSSAIGDIFEIQKPLLSTYQFDHRGKYRMEFQHYMRIDSLYKLTGVGLRVEKSITEK
jgi:gliding motility-associated lipoprotein GldH